MQIRLVALLPLLLLPCHASAGEPSGTLAVIQMNPVMIRYFDPDPETARTLSAGELTLDLDQHYTSVLLADYLPIPNRYAADMELYMARFRFGYALADDINVRATLPLIYAWRGFMDAPIRQFHNAFGMPDGGRHLRPDNRYAYLFNGKSGGWNGGQGWNLGDLSLRLKYRALHDESLDFSLLAAVKLPTASHRGWGSGNADLAAGVALSWEGEQLFHHLNLWGVKPLTGQEFGTPIRPYFRALLASGWKPEWLAAWLEIPIALLVQVQGGLSPYRTGLLQADRPPWLISFGARFRSDSGRLWSVTFVENITQRSTQDFGISVGVELQSWD